jgi:phosphoserine phosphatase
MTAGTRAQQWVATVLALAPQVAVFDCDSTLWDADSGMEFFYWVIERGLVDQRTADWALPRYDDYRAGRVDEKTMCGEMVQICRGLPVAAITEAARAYFREKLQARIFPEMLALTNALRAGGCELWAVSSSSQWLIEVEAAPFGFAADHVFAAAVEVEDRTATDRLLRVPTGPDKATVLKAHVAKPIDLAFGNSMHDLDMLGLAGHAFAINPNPDLEETARARGWTVYWPEAVTAARGS